MQKKPQSIWLITPLSDTYLHSIICELGNSLMSCLQDHSALPQGVIVAILLTGFDVLLSAGPSNFESCSHSRCNSRLVPYVRHMSK